VGIRRRNSEDVIVSLINSAGGFLKQRKFVQRSFEERKVKKATISVNLSIKKFFEKVKDGTS